MIIIHSGEETTFSS